MLAVDDLATKAMEGRWRESTSKYNMMHETWNLYNPRPPHGLH
jgi:hypothetical protein